MEDAVSTCRYGLVAEHTAGSDDADRRFVVFHNTHLHRRRMRTQSHLLLSFLLLDKEGVLHIAGRVVVWKIKSREQMPIILNLNRFRDCKADTGKDVDNFIHHYRKHVAATDSGIVSRKSQVVGLRLLFHLLNTVLKLFNFILSNCFQAI